MTTVTLIAIVIIVIPIVVTYPMLWLAEPPSAAIAAFVSLECCCVEVLRLVSLMS